MFIFIYGSVFLCMDSGHMSTWWQNWYKTRVEYTRPVIRVDFRFFFFFFFFWMYCVCAGAYKFRRLRLTSCATLTDLEANEAQERAYGRRNGVRGGENEWKKIYAWDTAQQQQRLFHFHFHSLTRRPIDLKLINININLLLCSSNVPFPYKLTCVGSLGSYLVRFFALIQINAIRCTRSFAAYERISKRTGWKFGRCHCSAPNWFFVGNSMALDANDERFTLRDSCGSIESTFRSNSTFSSAFNLHILGISNRSLFSWHKTGSRILCPQRKGHLECDISTHLSFNPIRKLILNCASGPRTPERMQWRMTRSWYRQSCKVD